MLSLILFIIGIIDIYQCITIRIPITKTQVNMYKIKVSIGNDFQIKDELNLDLSENTIIIYGDANYQPQKSQTAVPFSLDEFERSFSDKFLFVYYPNLSFNNIPIEQRSLITGTHGYFGMAYGNNSLLNRIFSSLNSKKIFYINTKLLEIGIGDYPQEMINISDKSNIIIRKCEMLKRSKNNYACNLDSIYFKSSNKNEYIQYNVNNEVNFCISMNAIYTSEHFTNIVYKKYLFEQIKEGTCEEIHSDSGYKFVRCKYNYDFKNDSRLTDISFIMGIFSFKLNRHELFALGTDNKLYFLIVNNPNNTGWFFGYPFFNKFLTVFDIESNLIKFISFDKE